MNNTVEIFFAAPVYGILRTRGHGYSYLIDANQDKNLSVGDVICMFDADNKIAIATVGSKRYEADAQTKYKPLKLSFAPNLNIYPRA